MLCNLWCPCECALARERITLIIVGPSQAVDRLPICDPGAWKDLEVRISTAWTLEWPMHYCPGMSSAAPRHKALLICTCRQSREPMQFACLACSILGHRSEEGKAAATFISHLGCPVVVVVVVVDQQWLSS